MSKIKFIIKEANNGINLQYNIFCDNSFNIQTNKNEGFFYINDYFKNQSFSAENVNTDEYCEVECSLINTIKYKEKFINFDEKKSIKNKELETDSNIKIGNLSKAIYINKIELILFTFDKIINNYKNEKELFESIKQLIKN